MIKWIAITTGLCYAGLEAVELTLAHFGVYVN